MIEYVIPHNPDDRVLKKISDSLIEGGLVCFPTDTNWIVACDPFNKKGVEKIYKLKNENKQKHFSLLCANISEASKLANIDNQAFKLLKRAIPGHYTFIFEASKITTKNLSASKTDKEVGIRFVPSVLSQKILEHYGASLLSTNLTKEILDLSDDSELEGIYSFMIEEKLSHVIDHIIDPGEFEFVGPSTIVDFVAEGAPVILREGAGDPKLFQAF